MRNRKTYNPSQLQELVDDLKKFGLNFAVQFNCKSRTLKLVTNVKSYFYPCDSTIESIVVYENNELVFKLSKN